MLTINQLSGCFPDASTSTLQTYLPGVNLVAEKCQINTPLRMRAFLAQTGAESAEFEIITENLNYSAEALQRVFSKYFPTATLAKKYARHPEQIANRVYANRMGNGPEASGDGWRYRGRGLIQITGHNNYTALAAYLGKDITSTIAYCETPEGACMGAGWYWATNNLNRWADAQDMISLTRAIDGGLNGFQDRMAIYNRSKKYIF